MTELLSPRLMGLRKESMKAKTKLMTATLSAISAAFKQILVDEKKEALTQAEEITVLKRMIKQRVDSAKQFADADRPELQAKELEEISILEGFLPPQMNEEEMTAAVQEVLDTLDSPTMKQMGMVMGKLQKHKSSANMSEMNAIVRKLLS